MAYKTFREAKRVLHQLEAIDYFFAKQVLDFLQNDSNKNLLTADDLTELFHILMCLQLHYRKGHSCMPITAIAKMVFWDLRDQDTPSNNLVGYKFSDNAKLADIINKLNLAEKSAISYHFDSLYINRLWLFESEISQDIIQRTAVTDNIFSYENIKTVLDSLFASSKTEIDWQKVAVAKSLIKRISVISGGPGTGKTTTVARLILALQQLSNKKLNIQLVAPTGKAAQRLKESIIHSKSIIKNVDTSELPDEATTLHRFLGLRANSTHTKYNKDHKALCDVLIVDEASMIDINMFVYIIRAIKDDCKLVLLGDVNQLPSVETGNILSELAKSCNGNNNTIATNMLIDKTCGYSLDSENCDYDFMTFLQKSYRTDSIEILKLANDVINSNQPSYKSSNSIEYNMTLGGDISKISDDFIKEICIPYFKQITQANSAKQALEILKQFRILVANKNIDIGTERLNEKISRYLGKNLFENYHGKPIMVVENDYNSKLFNGDVGIVWNDKAYFESDDNQLKEIGLSRLPKIETVYAMTIHKTQGSEFDIIAIMLPNEHNQLLTRELLYTGITRAKSKVYVVANQSVWEKTITKKIERYSNLSRILMYNI